MPQSELAKNRRISWKYYQLKFTTLIVKPKISTANYSYIYYFTAYEFDGSKPNAVYPI